MELKMNQNSFNCYLDSLKQKVHEAHLTLIDRNLPINVDNIKSPFLTISVFRVLLRFAINMILNGYFKTKNFTIGRDVITSKTFEIKNTVTIPAKGEYILELF